MVSNEIINDLKAKRAEIEQELVALEGAPSVAAALREIRSKHSIVEVRGAGETALTLVRNILTSPKDLRVYRVKKGNPSFHRNLGRLHASTLLMRAIGFVDNSPAAGAVEYSLTPENMGGVYVLKAVDAVDAFDPAQVLDPVTGVASLNGKYMQ